MPKVRERSRITQEFSVTPWQSRREVSKETTQGALYVVEETLLLAPASAAESCPSIPPQGRLPRSTTQEDEDVDTTGWFVKTSRPVPDPVSLSESNEVAPQPGTTSLPPLDLPTWEFHSARTQGRRPPLEGFCQLAITPEGRGMGHILIAGASGSSSDSSSGRQRGARCFSLALRPVPTGVPPDPCTDDDSADLLCVRLTNLVNGVSVDVLAGRTGGDMCRLAPPEHWLLQRWFGEDIESDTDTTEVADTEYEPEWGGRENWGEEVEAVEEWGDGEEHEHGSLTEKERSQALDMAQEMIEEEEDEMESAAAGAKGCRPGQSTASGAASEPHSALEWVRWWQRQRQRRPVLELLFEPDTMLSGSAAVPKLAEFARPLLPPQLARAAGGASYGDVDVGVNLEAAEDKGGIPRVKGKAVDVDVGTAAALDGEQGRLGTVAVLSAAKAHVEVEAVVCLGSVKLCGLPRTFLRAAG